MPRISRKKRVLRTLDSTLHALQVLDFIFDDGADPYVEDLSTGSSKLQKKRYWMLRKNLDIPMNSLPRWLDSLYDHQNSRKFRFVVELTFLSVERGFLNGKPYGLMSRSVLPSLLLGWWPSLTAFPTGPSKLNASYELLIGCRV